MVANRDEHFEHLLCEPRLPVLEQISSSGTDPRVFIAEETEFIVAHYVRVQRYGMGAFYTQADDIPAPLLEAFDIVAGVLDKPVQPPKQKGVKRGKS